MSSAQSTAGRPTIFLHPSDELYGADRVLLDIARAGVRRGSAFQVWVPNDLPHGTSPLCVELQCLGADVRHLALPIMRRDYQNPRGVAHLAANALRLVVQLRRSRPAAVYCTTSAALLGAVCGRIARVPTVFGHLQEIWSSSDRRLLSGPASACSTLIVTSRAVRSSLPGRLRARCKIVPNGTSGPDRVVSLRGRSGPLTFLVASRWNGGKGYGTLLKAWDLAGAPGRLVILGGLPPSGDFVDVEALVRRLRHPATVSVVGEVPDTAPYVDAADVVLVPSDRPEGFGLVAVEAFAHQRPVIASAAGGLVDIVTPDVDGWLFPPGDAYALAALLRRVDRDSVSEAGRRGRQTYEDRYTVDHFAHGWREATSGAFGASGLTRA